MALGRGHVVAEFWDLFVAGLSYQPGCLNRVRVRYKGCYKMEPGDAVELVRAAVLNAMIIGAPLLVVGMVVGLVISLLQAVTQIQDQTISAVPKILAMIIALVLCLPWIADRMIDYTRTSYINIPDVVSK
jgi:flagellar biosynthesis protein FliQ